MNILYHAFHLDCIVSAVLRRVPPAAQERGLTGKRNCFGIFLETIHWVQNQRIVVFAV